MNDLTSKQKINIFKNLFKGREDVFAVHWEKADKSKKGYTPVCLNEWKNGICIKLQREKCKDCKHQRYAIFNDYYVEQHLRGNKIYGIYPLLEDNSSFFIVADFDGGNWKKDAGNFIKKCDKYHLPVYLERSKSGNGGHVWIFFVQKYPAYKSRNVVINILREAKIIDQFEKEDSFDRLFPNQDNLSGKGFGNLIALPLQRQARKVNNSIFLNPTNNFEPFENQWEFLNKIERISLEKINKLYEKFNKTEKTIKIVSKSYVAITLKEKIFINKNNLPRTLVNFLKEELNFFNSEYLIKKKIGVSTYGMERYFKLIETENGSVSIPRGFINRLINFLNDETIKFEIVDERNKLKPIETETSAKLFPYQKEAIDAILMEENGILVAPPGSGKTIIGIELIARLSQSTLILVHKKQIFDQWVDRIENFLDIPKKEIGKFSSGKKKIGDKVTVAMVQTLNRMDNLQDYSDSFGMIIVDECHHMPAKMFRNIITKLNPYYLYGLTATPERKNNDDKLIFIYLGEVLYEIEKNFCDKKSFSNKNSINGKSQKPKLIIRETNLKIPFKIKTNDFQILSKIMIFDSNRNEQIIGDIKNEVNNGLKCLILTERKEHVEVLSYYLKKEYEIITLTGDLTQRQRNEKIKQIESGNFQVLIATGQLIGEGTDFPNLDCLFLVYPFSFSGKLTQYIGRIQRGSNENNIIYDYRDSNIDYLEKLFKKRKSYYTKNFGL
ncbi:MAG: DEAD/DEAH box helicase [Candidatus Pacebacteria bacterium]|nr:DEAD/DEAH box helicase [Candidatus Paceibacterota bacterium]